MYLVGVTLRWLKYLRYAPEVENVRYTNDKGAARKKKDAQTHHKYRDSPPRRKGVNATGANAKLVS